MAKILGVTQPAEMKNLAINGAFDFWQRVEGNISPINTATTIPAVYAADMFTYQSGGSTVKNYSIARSTSVLPTLAQSGFNSTYSYLFTMVTGIASPAAGDYVLPVNYRMEGLDYERLHTKTVTFGFWFFASVAGTYSFALGNAAGTRSYVTTFVVNSASTWQFVSITVTLDTTGTWAFDNTLGLVVYIAGITGSTFATSTLNSWQAGEFLSASGTTNWQATTNATINIAQFSIIEGTLGFSSTGFLRQGKTIQQELALCQRYYEKSYDIGVAPGSNNSAGAHSFPFGGAGTANNGANFRSSIYYKVSKRTDATSIGVWDLVGNANTFSWTNAANAQTNNTTGSINTLNSGHSSFNYNASTPVSGNTYCSVITHWAAEDGV